MSDHELVRIMGDIRTRLFPESIQNEETLNANLFCKGEFIVTLERLVLYRRKKYFLWGKLVNDEKYEIFISVSLLPYCTCPTINTLQVKEEDIAQEIRKLLGLNY